MALSWIARILIVLAHLAGLVVGIILLVRKKGTPAILATVAFGTLFVLDIARILQGDVIIPRLLLRQLAARNYPWAVGVFNCCCGLFDLIAIGCLIAALWSSIAGPAAKTTEEEEGTPQSAA